MDRYCRICRNTSCNNHGKDITFLGEGWQCDYIPVPTNADHIRAMSDEELADVIANGVGCVLKAPHCMDDDCTPCILRWLKQPYKGELVDG